MSKSEFSHQLRSLRESFGLTQAQLTFRLGISSSAVGMYEQGRREPDSSMLAKICTEFNTTTDFLLGIKQYQNTIKYEVNEIIEEFTNSLKNHKLLTFNGKPISETEKEKIIAAIRIAAAIAISSNY